MKRTLLPWLLTVASVLFVVGRAGAGSPTLLQQFFVLKSFAPEVKRVGVLLSSEPSVEFKKKLAQASAAVGVRSIVSVVSGLHDMARAYNELLEYYKVEFLWVQPGDPIVASEPARDYLVRKAIQDGVGICAPSRDWVDKGAALWVGGSTSKVVPYYNTRTLQALGLVVPDKYARVSTAATE